ncbi:hypothetical protein F2Q69_00023575 [Brassica cretica]|uniref:Uncharacterized protein n=1 Tax=Brassica cretica TaxID=69181 RepID=A0A8S9QSR4_BRACR|nr:hypothetical protein F2Q69_00023575 [Brassica cretica]
MAAWFMLHASGLSDMTWIVLPRRHGRTGLALTSSLARPCKLSDKSWDSIPLRMASDSFRVPRNDGQAGKPDEFVCISHGRTGLALTSSLARPCKLSDKSWDSIPLRMASDSFRVPRNDGQAGKPDEFVKLFHIRKYGRFSLSEVFHFLEGSSVPGTELGVPSSGDLERSLSGTRGSGSCLEAGENGTGVLPWEYRSQDARIFKQVSGSADWTRFHESSLNGGCHQVMFTSF